MVMVKKVIKPKKPKAAPKPKASKPKKKKLSEGDKAFHCNVKLGGKILMYQNHLICVDCKPGPGEELDLSDAEDGKKKKKKCTIL